MQLESDLDFMEHALDVIIRGRAVLKWSYIHGYWLRDQQEQGLFQHLQGVLEGNLEMLHNSLEPQEVAKILYSDRDFFFYGIPAAPLRASGGAPAGGGGASRGAASGGSGADVNAAVKERLIAYRQKVIDMAATTSSFIGKLIEGVENGLTYVPESAAAGGPTGGAPSQPLFASSSAAASAASCGRSGGAAAAAPTGRGTSINDPIVVD